MGSCKCHFCGKENTLFVLADLLLPKGESVCMDCYNVGKLALNTAWRSIKFEENYDNKPWTYTVYKVDAFGNKLECYEKTFKRRGNAFRYMRELAKLYID